MRAAPDRAKDASEHWTLTKGHSEHSAVRKPPHSLACVWSPRNIFPSEKLGVVCLCLPASWTVYVRQGLREQGQCASCLQACFLRLAEGMEAVQQADGTQGTVVHHFYNTELPFLIESSQNV